MKTLTVRPPWYSFSSLIILAIIAGCAVLTTVSGGGMLVAAAVFLAGWVWGGFGASINVTEAVVLLRVWPFIRRSVPRDQIQAMRLFGQFVSFEDSQHRALLKIQTLGYTWRQWMDISEALAVPLYDHRTKWGGHDAREGRLMQRSGPGAK